MCVFVCMCVCDSFSFSFFFFFSFFCANSKAISQVSGTDSESDTDLESTMYVQAYCRSLFFFLFLSFYF